MNTLDAFNTRVQDTASPLQKPYIHLTATNASAGQINMRSLAEINQPEYVYTAEIFGKFDQQDYPTEYDLRLKVGAQIMMVKNDPYGRWVNGSLGTVLRLNNYDHHENGAIWVEIDGEPHCVEAVSWEKNKYVYDRATGNVDQRIIGVFKQFPIRLAWAITIHKSQGQTFDRVIIDLGRGAFAHGQTYVALSRSRTLEGITLARPLTPRDIKFDPKVTTFSDFFSMNEIEASLDAQNEMAA
jgi:ATP-dependent exoDNAse (exonuclease V) alpha subunit